MVGLSIVVGRVPLGGRALDAADPHAFHPLRPSGILTSAIAVITRRRPP
jgi:hypothetical protein